ncbi:MAG: hypothetical protein RMX68_016695 [Aulosira sp. ZfuVER01]|nr:hypothetical protein [Aulosira sp. DedVER01a]MDZ8055906.1 hypothetical protein [Aulosira sp. ZfuCHP01]
MSKFQQVYQITFISAIKSGGKSARSHLRKDFIGGLGWVSNS